jgi:hypothetical protein
MAVTLWQPANAHTTGDKFIASAGEETDVDTQALMRR